MPNILAGVNRPLWTKKIVVFVCIGCLKLDNPPFNRKYITAEKENVFK